MASPARAGSVPGRIPTTFAARISSAAISTRILTRAPVVNDAAGLAGQRPTVRGPLAAGLEAPRRRRGELEAARRRRARRGLEDERLEIRSRVAAGPKARGREPVGDLTRGAIAAGGARAAALHFRSRQRLHVGAEPRGVGRDDGGARESAHGGDQQRREQQEGDNQAASHTHILLQLWWGVPSPAREES